MKLGVVRLGAEVVPVVIREGVAHRLAVAAGTTLVNLLEAGPEQLAAAVERAEPAALSDVRLEAPLRPGKVIAIALNYMDHIRESGLPQPEQPLIFAKFPSSVIGREEPIVIDAAITSRVDWEVELTAVIGRRARSVSPGSALQHIAGYTVGNDISARDLQFGDGQWVRGKSLDSFCPLGPVLVTADEIPDPQSLRLTTAVNGEIVQDSSTAEMIFGVAELVSFCSRMLTPRTRRRDHDRHAVGDRGVHDPEAVPRPRRCGRGQRRGHRHAAESCGGSAGRWPSRLSRRRIQPESRARPGSLALPDP